MFKVQLNQVYSKPKKNSYYYYGDRRISCFLSSIRTKCSQLRNDLFNNKILLKNTCTCGLPETAFHYFLNVQTILYKEISYLMTHCLFKISHYISYCMEVPNVQKIKICYYLMQCPNIYSIRIGFLSDFYMSYY